VKRRGGLGGRTLGLALALMALTAAVPLIVIALLTAGGSDPAPAPDATTVRAAQAAVAFPIFWAGESVAGLPLTGVVRTGGGVNVQYGSCTPSGGEGGCAPPVTIQTASICARNPLVLDLRPRSSSRVRGVPARDYVDYLSLEIDTANVTVFTRPEHRQPVLSALQPVRAAAPAPAPGGELTPPRYPRAYVLELRLVRDTYRRFGSLRAVRDRLGISRSAVRQRLAFARELGGSRLRRPGTQFVSEAGCLLEPAS
jgi:hypothetical protein